MIMTGNIISKINNAIKYTFFCMSLCIEENNKERAGVHTTKGGLRPKTRSKIGKARSKQQ
jgi:hypothetical protein